MRCLIAGIALLACAAAQAQDAHGAADLYGALPAGTGLRLSPDGNHLALIAGTAGQLQLVVWHLDGGDPTVVRTGSESPRWVVWKNDQKLVAGLYKSVLDDPDRPYQITRLAAFDKDGSHLTHIHPDPKDETSYTMLVTSEQAPEMSSGTDGGEPNPSSPLMAMGPGLKRTVNPSWAQFQDELLSLLPNDNDHVLVAAMKHPPPAILNGVVSRDIPGSLAGAAIATALGGWAGHRATAREVNAVDYLADQKGDVRLKVETVGTERRLYVREAGHQLDTDSWRLIQTAKIDKAPLFGPSVFAPANLDADRSFVPLVFDDANPDILHVSMVGAGGHLALGRFDIASGQMTGSPIEAADADVTPLLLGARLVGYRAGRGPSTYFDTALNDRVAAIRKSLATQDAEVIDVSTDGKRILLSVSADGDPPIYWMYDRRGAKPSLAPVLQTYPQLAAGQGVAGRWVSIKARDGLTIPALLTLPADHGSGKLPFVVLPHDGPADHDRSGFDWLAQYLVHLGYGVLQPDYRGSTGFGLAFERAGDREWGWKMQDDISDATAWLVAQGLAGKDGVCIVGQGYGGYAALMGVVREPSLYRCAAALDPLTNLQEFVRDRENRGLYRDINIARIAKPDQEGVRSSVYNGGSKPADPTSEIIVTAEREEKLTELEKISPVYHAKDIRVPVLLAHARQDFTIPVTQSEEMERVLKRVGAPVSALYFEGDDQSLHIAADRIAFLEALQKFLASSLQPRSR